MSYAPIWAVATVRLGKMLQPSPLEAGDVEVAYLKSGHLAGLTDLVELPRMWASAADLRRYELRPGDLLVAEGGDLGASSFFRSGFEPAIFQNSLHRVRLTREGDIRFLRYALEAFRATGTIDAMCDKATFGHYTLEKIKRTRVPWPEPEHQQLVADSLDRECERIDRLSSELTRYTRRLADPALEEFRHLTQGISRGRIGYRYEVQLGKMLDEKRIDSNDLNPYLRNANVHWDRLELSDVKSMTFSSGDRRKFGLRPGDVLVCEGGEPGRAAVWNGEIADCYYQKALHRLRAYGDDSPRFLFWCLRDLSTRGAFGSDGPGRYTHLTAEQLRAVRIPLPAPSEQRRIAEVVDTRATSTTHVSEEVDGLQLGLRQYRDALITEAVTGKLDIDRLSGHQLDESVQAASGAARREVLPA